MKMRNDNGGVCTSTAKPFLSWVGGKGRILDKIDVLVDRFIKSRPNEKFNYVEPFVGGGSMLFHMLNKYRERLNQVIIGDSNTKLMSLYYAIQNDIDGLLSALRELQDEYNDEVDESNTETRKEFYLLKRKEFNEIAWTSEEYLRGCALFLYLNRACYNGVFRVNRKGEFNTPIGTKKCSHLYDSLHDTLISVNKSLQGVSLIFDDYECMFKYYVPTSGSNLIYLDPPYKPISENSNFTRYTSEQFTDEDQMKLCTGIKALVECEDVHFILSNSYCPEFFGELYSGFSMEEIEIYRGISVKNSTRGNVKELLIHNIQ